jgi:muconolactone delta-isomerase
MTSFKSHYNAHELFVVQQCAALITHEEFNSVLTMLPPQKWENDDEFSASNVPNDTAN